MSSKYINGNIELGLNYDWRKIFKEYEKLGCPKDVYSPLYALRQGCKYNIAVSERSTGKTTNWILLGMVMNKHYGTQIQYIRQSEAMITPKNINSLMSVIVACGYIEKLTDGRYNNVEYRARHWRYTKVDPDSMEVLERSESFMYCLDLDHNETYKSSYNAPLGDLIIFDEFISRRYAQNEFVVFCDLVKTIIRERQSPIVVMLANTTDRYNTYFQELGIQQQILGCRIGDSFKATVGHGTTIFCELVGTKNPERAKQNSLFFGFKNPRLASVTGGDWAIDSYPHIQREDAVKHLSRFLYFNGAVVELELCSNERLGLFVKAHVANKVPEGSINYQLDEITERHQRHRFGHDNVDKKLWQLFARNKWYYSTNEVGNIVTSYVNQAK